MDSLNAPADVRRATRPPTPQATFDRVAKFYDLINRLLSLGMDQRWRRRLADSLQLPRGARVLDVATGTGYMARCIAQRYPDLELVLGCDRNQRMLMVAAERAGSTPSVLRYLRCRAERLPLEDHSFDATSVAFAIDDMEDRSACMSELARVLRPGGQLALLELSLPEDPLLLRAYRAYLWLLSLPGTLAPKRGVAAGYAHLREEILTYRGRRAVENLIRAHGFIRYRCENLTGGLVTLHLAWKPASPRSASAAGRQE